MYYSNLAAFTNAFRDGADKGLTAAAEFYTRRVQARLLPGYTTGAFSHGIKGVAGRVMFGKPFAVPGGRAINVGTSTAPTDKKGRVRPYEIYWEKGHPNLFTGTFMHVPIWMPVGEESGPMLENIIGRNIRRSLDAAGFPNAPVNIRVAFGAPTVRTR